MVLFIKVQKALIKNRKKLLKKHIEAVGIGYKVKNGKQTCELAIICSVRKKLPIEEISKKDLIPREIKGVKTDVIEVGVIKALHTNRHRPAPGGVSVGHVLISAGTLGCVVKKDSIRYMLSNNHVLACSNEAKIGDSILQPGSHDSGKFPEDHIADLKDFVPINFSGIPSECPITGLFIRIINGVLYVIRSNTRLQAVKQAESNLVDAAIAQPLNDEDISDEIMEIGKIEGVKSAILGMKIQKSGRTTGLTQGEITQINVTANIQYGEGKIAQFTDQIMSGPMSTGGDSGSAILTEDSKLCGLLFAGSDQITICNRIEHVFELLDVRLEGKN
ncbi:hypothetical protein KAX02_13765 [candidate division WOR-3 bacterium]|nr:hypothetical protein [candidate division WOR-3 bacterium]